MPRSDREETLSSLTSLILSSVLDELVLDATLQSHHEVARGSVVCKVCNTKCNAVHVPPSLNNSASSSQGLPAPSRSGTPSSNGDPKGTGANTPTNSKADGNLYLECINCSRQISSNRYAPHLSSCMGLANSRRGPPRSNSKPKPPSEAGRSASPSSEAGYMSEDKSPNKGKHKGKLQDESEYTLKRKRAPSPQISPAKKAKGKPIGSPISRVKADADGSGVASNPPNFPTANNSQSRVPSKLRDSSVARGGSSASSRSSSPEGTSAPTPASSFTQSPSLAARGVGNGRGAPRGRAHGTGPPKRPSPPRPPPPMHTHYPMDVEEGDETGSSTDTSDSS